MGGEYFSQLHVAEDRSLGEARIGQELVDEQGNAQILERNGAPGIHHRSGSDIFPWRPRSVHVTFSSKNGLLSNGASQRSGASARIRISSVYRTVDAHHVVSPMTDTPPQPSRRLMNDWAARGAHGQVWTGRFR